MLMISYFNKLERSSWEKENIVIIICQNTARKIILLKQSLRSNAMIKKICNFLIIQRDHLMDKNLVLYFMTNIMRGLQE